MPPWVCSARSAAVNPASAHRYFAVFASRPHGLPLSYSHVALRSTSSAASRRARESASGNCKPWFIPIGRWHDKIVDEHLVGADRIAAHLGDWPDVDVVGIEIGQEQRQAVGFLC